MPSHMTIRKALAAAVVAAVLWVTASGQEDVSGSEREGDNKQVQWLTARDIPGIAVIVVLILSVPTAVYLFQRRKYSFGDSGAEADFEREVMQELNAGGASPATARVAEAPSNQKPIPSETMPEAPVAAKETLPWVPKASGFDTRSWSEQQTQLEDDSGRPTAPMIEVQTPLGSGPAKRPRPAAPTPTPSEPPIASPRGVDQPPANLEELVRRLQTLTIIGDLEGRISMPVPPDGLIYRLRKSDGIAAILPRLESEAIMAHHARRFDMVFALTVSGEVIVLSRLQNRLSELMERAGDFDTGSASFFQSR